MDIAALLGNKFSSLDDQLKLLSRQLKLQQRFLKLMFPREYEEFVNEPEQIDVSNCCGVSGDTDADTAVITEASGPTSTLSTNQEDEQGEDFEEEEFHPVFVAPAEPEREYDDLVNGQEEHNDVSNCCGSSNDDNTPEFPEAASTVSTYQQDEQSCDDFEEEKFHPTGFVAPAEPEHYSEFCYAQFEKAMGLRNANSLTEVPSDLETFTSRRMEDSNSVSGATSAAAVPSSSSNAVRRLQRKKQVEEDPQGNLPKRPCRMKLRKRRPNAPERQQNPKSKRTGDRMLSDGNPENLEEIDEDGEDSLASGRTSEDFSSSQDESDEEMTTRRGVRFRTPKMKLVRKAGLSGPTASGSSTLRPQNQNGPTERRFKCSVCLKKFLSASDLRRHQLIHTNEKPHKCSYCEKSFRLAGDQRIHELIHTGEKPHECSYCDKRFRRSYNRRVHELIHAKEKPYACSHCGKGFRRASNRRDHELIHTGEKPRKCSFCSERFRDLTNLRRHEVRHHHRRPQ